MKTTLSLLFSVALLTLACGCVNKRTITEGGRVVEEKFVFRAPLIEAFQNSKDDSNY